MKALRFWLPLNGYEQEIIIPAEYVESIIVPGAEHEAGHIIAAHHYGGRVLGIGIGFIPELEKRGMFLQALYQWKDWSIETQCVVKASGPAADILYFRGFSEAAASGDLRDIEELTGKASLEPYLGMAQEILVGYSTQLKGIATLLRESLENFEERTLGLLPDYRIGTLLVDETLLMQCLGK
jgi:hypothetical protein